jgi:FlaA1/EpsC-like NDP-sugar epimerase
MRSRLHIRNRYVLVGDIILTVFCVLASFALRLELGPIFNYYLPSAYYMVVVAVILAPLVYRAFGLYRRMWIYASIQDLKVIFTSVIVASAAIAAVMILLFTFGAFQGFPRSVLIIYSLLSMLAVGGLRFALRVLAESRFFAESSREPSHQKHILIIGAGDAGALVLREMQKSKYLNMKPVGFLDDNPDKLKQQLLGVPVIGSIDDLPKVLAQKHIDEVIIAIPSAPGDVVRRVASVCQKKGIPFRTMPGLYELLGGKINISRLREIEISDLLRRQPTQMLDEEIGKILHGETVMVTGAGGSIGRELCRQISRWEPGKLLLLGHGENSIFESFLELEGSNPNLSLKPLIADIRDERRIGELLREYKPGVVFHTAAHKHVPLMEVNVPEAVSNNVLGTLSVVEGSLNAGVNRFVLISTDKAIRPANVMGGTKRIAEMIVLNAAKRSRKPYSVVRFGNVLGSRGSVVPLFKRQIAKGGPVTVTHPDMKRYFMTIPEAVYLVLQAATLGEGGEAFLLNMGEQVKIVDLAEDLIRLSGLEPGKDIEIVFTGIRPGEKISEDLWDEGHEFMTTMHPDIFRVNGHDQQLSGRELRAAVTRLRDLAVEGDSKGLINFMDDIIPGATIGSQEPPAYTSID